jgi:ubiquinone/menaquinone biosynthesis C-methylase UbiE
MSSQPGSRLRDPQGREPHAEAGHRERVAEAFSRKSLEYDIFGTDHPNQTRMRHRVYANLEPLLAPGARILELNAGTGTDAVYLAGRGFRVHATDIAPGMLAAIEEKARRHGVGDRLTVQNCSFTELDQIECGPFDAVFSNFGGLNCIDDLPRVTGQLARLLVRGGVVVWVIMPPICPWELLAVLRGAGAKAFRRLRPGGVIAHVSGVYFRTHYYSPGSVRRAFGPGYRLLGLEGLSVFCPPADHKEFAHKRPGIYRVLVKLDDLLGRLPPFRSWGDFFILSLRYVGP